MPVRVDTKTRSVPAKKLIFAVATSTWAVFPVFPAPSGVGIFFRSASNEIGNSDHQAVQAGCSA